MRLLLLSSLLLLGFAPLPPAAAADAVPKIRLLLLTGDDVAPAHNWRETAQATRDVLEGSGRFEVRVCEDPAILESAGALARYDAVLLDLFNQKTPTLSDGAKSNLLAFVSGGKGFIVTHLASASFGEWDEFKKLCGRYWVMGKSGHGPRAAFRATVKDTRHAATQGIKDFSVDDELYAKLQGDAPIEVLVTADSDWSKATEPLVFVLSYGNGRVFHSAFGHDAKAIRTPEVSQLLVQGCAWAATGAAP